ncbi:1,4-beta-D-xylan synthase [Trifolium repens]|nr:1,4-beta-D-xylan synthase [Trifolium repens]
MARMSSCLMSVFLYIDELEIKHNITLHNIYSQALQKDKYALYADRLQKYTGNSVWTLHFLYAAMLASPNVEPEYGLEADGENLIDTTDVSAFGLSAFTRA